jgi:hypothetical protein
VKRIFITEETTMSIAKFKSKKLFTACALLLSAAQAGANPVTGALGEWKPIIDVRARFEQVEQLPLAEDAEAGTVRARLGAETGKAWNTALLIEGEFLTPFITDYNSTVNGKTMYPIVADPENYELNRVHFTNTSLPGTTLTIGRQRINIDDQRFVGNVGWRMNEQTFDALRAVNKSVSNLTVDVTYFNRVNRVFGKDSPQGHYEGNSFLGNVAYQLPVGKLTVFGYFVEIDPIVGVAAAVRDSNATYGLRFGGEKPVGKIKLAYAASYAQQEDYADNPVTFDNGYYLGELTASFRQFSAGVGIEVLEGDGVKGFTTPLATLHKFQGWADKFLATPVNGIDDRYINAGWSKKGVGPFDTMSLIASYHDYQAERVSQDYGSEINVQFAAKFQRFTGTLKYADYSADGLFTDTKKLWVQVDFVW